jgi:hypothetical protein
MTDVFSIVLTRPAFRYPHDYLYNHLKALDWVIITAYEVIALVLGTIVAMVCIGAFRYEKATAGVIQEYAKLLHTTKKKTKGSNQPSQ